MVLILSLFATCTVLAPLAGEAIRRRHRALRLRRRLEALLRDGEVAPYRPDRP